MILGFFCGKSVQMLVKYLNIFLNFLRLVISPPNLLKPPGMTIADFQVNLAVLELLGVHESCCRPAHSVQYSWETHFTLHLMISELMHVFFP